MNKTLKKTGIFCLFGFLLMMSCNKFDEINTNPNATVNVNASLLATKVILQNFKFQGRDAKAYLSDNAIAKYIAYGNETILSTQYYYLGAADFTPMTLIPNVKSMIESAKGSSMENSYKALGKFSRAFMFYYLTMEVGDIPYSETGQGSTGDITPKYDTQESVFIGILNELKSADSLFANGITFSGDPTPYNGDPDKWRRATNAFTLKVLMSLSAKESDANLDLKNRFAAIVNENELMEANTGYLGLEYTSTNPHPLSGTNDLFTSRTMVSKLVLENLKNLGDKRLFYFADPAQAKIAKGGSESIDTSYIGPPVTEDYDDLTADYLNNKYSLLNSRYLKVQAGDPRIMMSFGEQQLILAEARILGWISTGTAQDYYESGVKAVLARYMNVSASYVHGNPITQSYIDNYFTEEAAFKSNPDDQLKQIWLQRWLSQFMQDPISAFFLQRRTGYPIFPVDPATSLNVNDKNAVPVRWLYPGSEQAHNKENLIKALDSQYGGVDDINKKMWLLQ